MNIRGIIIKGGIFCLAVATFSMLILVTNIIIVM
jgi:hypothetical protein